MEDRQFERGFTLVEVLVTVLILGLLAAVVFPVIADRAGDADPVRVANDLANVRSGVELFQVDVRTTQPGDIEDLVNAPTTTAGTPPLDSDVDGNSYSQGSVNKWGGPYLDLALASSFPLASTARTTGFDANILNGFGATTTEPGTRFLTVEITNLATPDQFNEVDQQIDGGDGGDAGILRHTGGNTAIYLAAPIKN